MNQNAYGCALASWTSGLVVFPDITLQGNNASTYETIDPDQYEVHAFTGHVIRKPYDEDGNAVDWTIYSAFRATYYLYDPTTNSATANPTNEAQTMTELDFGIVAFDPTTGRLNEVTAPRNKFLVGDYLSLGDYGTRPKSNAIGTGIWADKTGLYGLNASTAEFYLLASNGKAYAGGGAVVLDTSGITITQGATAPNTIKWLNSSETVGEIYTNNSSGNIEAFFLVTGVTGGNESVLTIKAQTDDGLPHLGTGSVSIALDTDFNGGEITISAPTVNVSGSFNSLGIDDNANAVGLTIDSTERVILTGTSTINHAGMNTILQGYSIATTAAAVAGASFGQFSADTRGAQVNLSKSRNTSIALGAAVSSGDTLGQILFTGDDGDSFDTGATIRALVDGTPGAADMPTRLEFLTSADGSATPTLRLTIDSAGKVTMAAAASVATKFYINDSADANVTVGAVFNQGANDDFILTLKSSDVAQGITDVAEADTYGAFSKVNTDRGGLEISGFKESGDATPGNAVRLRGYLSATANTTHNGTGEGIVNISGSVISGTGATTAAADSNLVTISNHNSIKFIFDAEGDSFEDGTGWTAYDDHNDIALLDTVNTFLLKANDPIKQEFWVWVNENALLLQDLKLISVSPDSIFINRSKMQELLVGAVRQMGARLDRLEQGAQ